MAWVVWHLWNILQRRTFEADGSVLTQSLRNSGVYKLREILLVLWHCKIKAFLFLLMSSLFFFFTGLFRYNLYAVPFTYFSVQLNGLVNLYTHL